MSGGLYSLATIIKRLEAATSRIEDIASLQGDTTVAGIRKESTDTSKREADPSAASAASAPPAAPTPAVVEEPKSVTAFSEAVIDGKLKPFVELTKSFAGASVIEIVGLIERQFADVRELILLGASCQKPDQKAIEGLLTPLSAGIEAIARAKETHRRDRDWWAHLTFIGEGGPSVAWVVNPRPGPYLADLKEMVTYYGNKVMQEFKTKDPKHVEWVRAFIAVLEESRKYAMEYHTTGLTWNPKGITVEQYESKSAASSAPPPPPPPPPPAPTTTPGGGGGGGGAAAVFADLNRGEEVTKGLRKVDKSEMTHKNPALRAGNTVSSSSSSGSPVPKRPIKPSKPPSLAGKKPPKLALEGNKWAIEYHENERALTLDTVELSHAVNIYGCKNCTVVIKGKVNAVTIANCQSTSVLVESVVSAISVTRAPSFVLQITGSAPMIQLDSTDSGQIYLSKGSLGVEITTAKCSSINVSLPVEGEEEGVFSEQAVAEMLRTVVRDGKLVTTVVEHVG